MSKENDHKKIEFLRQALESIRAYPYENSCKTIARRSLERYQEFCLNWDAEELAADSWWKAEQLSMSLPGKLVEDHES